MKAGTRTRIAQWVQGKVFYLGYNGKTLNGFKQEINTMTLRSFKDYSAFSEKKRLGVRKTEERK